MEFSQSHRPKEETGFNVEWKSLTTVTNLTEVSD